MAMTRREKASKAEKMTDVVIELIEDKLYQEWSPEQISGWLKEETIALR
jgi:transposase, IS30 family